MIQLTDLAPIDLFEHDEIRLKSRDPFVLEVDGRDWPAKEEWVSDDNEQSVEELSTKRRERIKRKGLDRKGIEKADKERNKRRTNTEEVDPPNRERQVRKLTGKNESIQAQYARHRAQQWRKVFGLKEAKKDTTGMSLTMDRSTKNKITTALDKTTKSGAPMDFGKVDIFGVLKKNGVVALQEDDTEWSGFFTGRDGRAVIPIAPKDSKNERDMYTPYKNTQLVVTWHKFDTGNYEIIAYVS